MSSASFSGRFGDLANNDASTPARTPPRTLSSQDNAQRLELVLGQIRDEIRAAVKQSGLTMVRSRFDTSDIVQESMLQIWRQLGDDDVKNLEFTEGLLSVIAKGHARKQMRFHTARKRTVSREQSAVDPGPTRDPGPLDHADIREQIGLMLSALDYIHPIRQLILFRRFFDDASYQDIAKELCRPKEWVRQQCIKAQKELKILLMH